jgi:hypothetical protein
MTRQRCCIASANITATPACSSRGAVRPAHKVPRSIYENAGDVARDIAKTETYVTSLRERKKIEMLFAHLKRILRLDQLRLRGPPGAQDEFLLAARVKNLRKPAKLIPLRAAPMPA